MGIKKKLKKQQEFKGVQRAAKEIWERKTIQEVDLAAGFLMGTTNQKWRDGKIDQEQKERLYKLIKNIWRVRRAELENSANFTDTRKMEMEGILINIP